ncbi:coiled-coil domain-containing protein R3HCC1L isoform X2 [Sesamum indicum]|uniref:Coiled-coil domain-containing protein R3HCC1L isoform X2 n=1 Tax=Sesamum indicum TaxID=4182 RepID=A0A6I9TTX5_SESIN|nr:coiled-coil domain-containing protein R3HCC1L isoform X2 [Sesamum indicum]
MESSGGASKRNWTEAVEDLLHDGEVEQAISLLESTVSNLENELEKEELENKNGGEFSSSTADQLSTALQDLSKLYSAKGYSLRADEILSRALQVKHTKGPEKQYSEHRKMVESCGIASFWLENVQLQFLMFLQIFLLTIFPEARLSQNDAATSAKQGCDVNTSNLQDDGFPQESCSEDDRSPEELLPSECLPGVSELSLEDSKAQERRRRGRGTFSYNTQGLYSDNKSDEPVIDDSESSSVADAEDQEKRTLLYGSHHVLVLSGFPPSIRTTDLEKLLEKFKESFVIRWVNDRTSLAVFKTPSIALEASNSIQWPFNVRVLQEDDQLLRSIPPRDLEPPRQRPPTSARTAQRMIAQGMGIRLPTTFGSAELRRQEEARRNRLAARQNMRDEAWGDDEGDAK